MKTLIKLTVVGLLSVSLMSCVDGDYNSYGYGGTTTGVIRSSTYRSYNHYTPYNNSVLPRRSWGYTTPYTRYYSTRSAIDCLPTRFPSHRTYHFPKHHRNKIPEGIRNH